MEGFNIPDWKPGTQFPTLRAALDAREFHADMHHLMESMRTHYDIPATFDGAIPELQFQSDKSISPLKIGDRYLVPNAEGVEVPAQLVNATVMEAEKMVYGVYRSNEGKVFIAKGPITEVELEAYKKYPDTFFGVVKYVGKQCKDLIDWYDFFFETYKDTSKKKLLEFMKDADDIQSLEKLSQQDLAKTYCERLAYGIANQEPNMYTG